MGGVASVIAGAYSIYAAEKAADATEEASEVSTAESRTSQIQAARQQMRERRIKSARAEAAAENTGGSGGSAVMGTQSALTSQAAANIAYGEGRQRAQESIADLQQEALDWDFSAQVVQTGAKIGEKLSGMAATSATG